MSAASEYAPPVTAAARQGSAVTGFLAGLAAAVAGALLWFGVGAVVGGIGIGLTVGWAMRRFGGGGGSRGAAVTAAVLALVGCGLGHLLAAYHALSRVLDMGYWDAVRRLPLSAVREVWLHGTTPFTWLIFAIAAAVAFSLVSQGAPAPAMPPASYPPPAYPPPAPPAQGDALP